MSSKQKKIEAGERTAAVAVLDPPESGPPTAEEMETGIEADLLPSPPLPAVPGFNPYGLADVVADLGAQSALVWPDCSPLRINWPWPSDPQCGDIIGWNWDRVEVARVVSVPEYPEPRWPFNMTVEIQPMPEEWFCARVFDLQENRTVEVNWYTCWNRAYEEYGTDEAGAAVKRAGGGWLGVQQVKA